MICPHCANTIREEDRYLMSRRPAGNSEPLIPQWARWPVAILVGLGILATLVLFSIPV